MFLRYSNTVISYKKELSEGILTVLVFSIFGELVYKICTGTNIDTIWLNEFNSVQVEYDF